MLTPGVIDVYQSVKSASGTLGARGASWRACRATEANKVSGTLGARSASWRARRIDDDVETNLDDPKTLTPDKIPKTAPLINCRPVQIWT